MSQQEKLPLPPQEPNVHEPHHFLPHHPLGQGAVSAHERSIVNDSLAEWNKAAAEFADKMDYGHIPDPLAPRTRNVARKILTGDPDNAGEQTNEIAVGSEQHQVAPRHSDSARIQTKVGDALRRSQHERIGAVRERLNSMSPDERYRFRKYFDEHAPQGLRTMWELWQQKTKPPMKDSQGKDVLDHDPSNMLAHAPEPTLLNFLQWHVSQMEEINRHPAVVERLQSDRVRTMESIVRIFGNKPFGQEAIAKLDLIDSQQIVIGDIFETKLRHTYGHYTPTQEMLVLEEHYEDVTFDHEIFHVMGHLGDTDTDEAMTEHLALVMENGYLYIVDPAERLDEGVYNGQRSLLSSRLTAGIGDNLLPKAIDAYFEDNPRGSKYKEYKAAETAAFGGVNVDRFVAAEQRIARRDIEGRDPKLPEGHKHDYELKHSAEGVDILGAIARGVSDDEIVTEKLRRFQRGDASNPNAHRAGRALRAAEETRIRGHIAAVRQYLEQA